MSSKTRTQQKNSQIKSNILKSYEACLKQGIPIGKIYGSDFIDGFIVKRYTYPPYPWNINLLLSNNKKIDKESKSQKSIRIPQENSKLKSISRKNKSKSSQRTKSKPKKNQRSKSRRR